jgi:hypothetical protein
MPKIIKIFFAVFAFLLLRDASAQGITIKGKVFDASNNNPIKGVLLRIVNSKFETKSNENGEFELTNLDPGFYSVSAELEGYKNSSSYEQLFTYDKQNAVVIEMESEITGVGQVDIRKSSLQKRSAESPVSSQELSIREIEKNPGGNRDISKIIQSLPGVITIPGFRNDIVIRGGSPAENKFYLDGIEIPIINHFQTQGSTGGPIGLLNVNFIKNVNFYTGAFPVNYANGLSAVMDFQQIDGNLQKGKYRFTVGSSDVGFTADGPIGKSKKISYIFSARQSYLQGVFSLLGLPFLPNFIDYQGKVKIQLKGRDNLTFVTVGAVDFFKLNVGVNEGITDTNKLKSNKYILGYLPSYSQWNYTFGAIYSHFGKTTKTQVFLSRNMLNNETYKYKDNDQTIASNLNLKFISREAENKLRVEHSGKLNTWNWMVGSGLEYVKYSVNSYSQVVKPYLPNPLEFKFQSLMETFKYNAFGRISGIVGKGTLVSLATRFDGSSYGENTRNLFFQPTISASVSVPLKDNLYFNANVGQFFQLPAYTVLGYKDSNGNFENKNRVKYIRNRMISAGFQYNQGQETKITLEGFYKVYDNYPMALNDSISLGNLGADFAVVGNEPVASISTGLAYGAEFLVQRRSRNGLYGILSYTLAWSQFADKNNELVASAWDSRHTLSIVVGKKLKKNWEIGGKWRFVTGRPYTPNNENLSMNVANWNVKGIAIQDYNSLNSNRLGNFNQFDIRVDKVWYKKKWSLNLYLDIQNFFGYKYLGPATLIARQDKQGNLLKDPNNQSQYLKDYLPNESGNVLPTIGIILDF